MPTYDYECDACGHAFELFQNISEEPQRKCPACKKKKLRRLPGTGAAIMFKGSGFYQTDYRSESYKSKAEAEQKAAGETSASESKSSGDGKSEAAKPAKAESNGAASKPASPSKGKKE